MDGKEEAKNDEQKEANKLVGAARKEDKKRQEQKEHDDRLYRPHG
jgi:hypothetical protein